MKEISKVVFGLGGRVLVYLNLILGITLLLYPSYYYIDTRENVLLIVALGLSIANILIALFSKYRFELIERYPYIINLPALALILYEGDLTPKERGEFINKMFSVVLKLGIFLGLYSLVIEYVVIRDIVFGEPINETLFISFSLMVPIIILFVVFAMYAKIYREIKERIK